MSGLTRIVTVGVAGLLAIGPRLGPERGAPASSLATPPAPGPQVGQASAARTVTPTVPPAAVLPGPLGSPFLAGAPLAPPPPVVSAEHAIVDRARREVEEGVGYDGRYWRLGAYPNGDLPPSVGACSDLVVRALRAVGIDLQALVHEDILAMPGAYATVKLADANIDHRRVPTLYTWFERNTTALPTDAGQATTFRPGDIVFYARPPCTLHTCIPAHVAIVSDRGGPRGLPLIVENGGPRAREGDALDQPTMVGHYRLRSIP